MIHPVRRRLLWGGAPLALAVMAAAEAEVAAAAVAAAVAAAWAEMAALMPSAWE